MRPKLRDEMASDFTVMVEIRGCFLLHGEEECAMLEMTNPNLAREAW